ncbi:uncharacterized protein LOC116689338 [Etheostoma spectabile]|uniref:uncharacterized protein LOC116689338 n=1 Tax=Etheostoma spectabile TaxID=54343 RepID=UPI0013AF8153|nr:uncharacterized protein LOC116689338 [Etheostoma spectabile]
MDATVTAPSRAGPTMTEVVHYQARCSPHLYEESGTRRRDGGISELIPEAPEGVAVLQLHTKESHDFDLGSCPSSRAEGSCGLHILTDLIGTDGHIPSTEKAEEGKGYLKSEASDAGFPGIGSDSDHQVKKDSAPSQVPHLVHVGETLAAAPEAKDDKQPPRSAQTLQLRNKPMVFEPLWERIQRKHTQEEHHTSKYKLDQKTIIDGIDCWESLKRQACLWRRDAQLVMSECGSTSSSEDKADYVLYRLNPIPRPSSHYQSKSSSKSGNCRLLSVVWGAN